MLPRSRQDKVSSECCPTGGRSRRNPPAGRPPARRKGDRLRLVTPTGGGYGDPRARLRSLVLEDLENGYVTPEQARRDYGVEIDK